MHQDNSTSVVKQAQSFGTEEHKEKAVWEPFGPWGAIAPFRATLKGSSSNWLSFSSLGFCHEARVLLPPSLIRAMVMLQTFRAALRDLWPGLWDAGGAHASLWLLLLPFQDSQASV